MRRLSSIIMGVLIIVLGVLSEASAADTSRTFIVRLKGKAVGETHTIPPLETTKTSSEGNCFAVDLTDVVTDKAMGTALRCFTDIKTVDNGMVLTDTVFFRLREGTIVSRHRTTIQPALDSPSDVTHIAAGLAAPMATTILADAGSGAFMGVPGSTRLAGAMDMRQFRERNTIAFNDIALIQLVERPMPAVDNQTRLRQAQKHLQEAGFTPGALDGMLGPQTREALQQYQAKHGLPKTGELDEATRKALGVQ
jgi:hypothetical protein